MKLLKKIFSLFFQLLIPCALAVAVAFGVLTLYTRLKEWAAPMADSWLTVDWTFKFWEVALICTVIGLLLAVIINVLVDIRWFFLERRLNKRIRGLEAECAQLKGEAESLRTVEPAGFTSGESSAESSAS
jgi:hypothetical protein